MNLVVGFDDTAYGRDALELGLQLANRSGEPATVVTVYPDEEATAGPNEDREIAERKLDVAQAIVGDRADFCYEAFGPAYASLGLHEFAEQNDAHLLVVGASEHAAVGAITSNSTVERLLNGAPCPVAVAPRGYHRRGAAIRDIAVAYDGSPESQQALGVAVQIARRSEASVRLVAVAPEPEEETRAMLDTASRELPANVKVTTEVVIGLDVADTLANLPGQTPDLLVCGSRGIGPRRRVLLGSASTRLIRSASYPVIVVPHNLGEEES